MCQTKIGSKNSTHEEIFPWKFPVRGFDSPLKPLSNFFLVPVCPFTNQPFLVQQQPRSMTTTYQAQSMCLYPASIPFCITSAHDNPVMFPWSSLRGSTPIDHVPESIKNLISTLSQPDNWKKDDKPRPTIGMCFPPWFRGTVGVGVVMVRKVESAQRSAISSVGRAARIRRTQLRFWSYVDAAKICRHP